MSSDPPGAEATGNVSSLEDARTIGELRQQLRDASAEIERLRDEIRHHAVTDEMTGLANRKGFYILAEHSLKHGARRGLPCLLVKLDIDQLARVNERFGHDFGDRTIGEVAQLLRDTFRASDILARTDGDEFCVLAQDPGDDAQVIRRRIEERIAAINQRSARQWPLAVHLAIACTDPDLPVSLDELLARADQALYAQKHGRQGRTRAA